MQTFKEIAGIRQHLHQLREDGKSIGFVPTMGALHEGHLDLIRRAGEENDVVVTSIFVNPTQFNDENDLLVYPRDEQGDLQVLQEVGCQVVFLPESAEMYPEKAKTQFNFGDMETVMEGKYRPGHFQGVALVVSKLLNIVQPDSAYFGEKDYQQYAIIARMASDLNMACRIVPVPTRREPDGLAMSSRNRNLDPAQREAAILFYQALKTAAKSLKNGAAVVDVKEEVAKIIDHPLLTLEYFEVADTDTLSLLENPNESVNVVLCIAGYAGEVRLIDNLRLHKD